METDIIELTLKQSLQEALEVIYNAKPDILCCSVYIWNSQNYHILLPEIRKLLPEVKIVIGGPEVSYDNSAFIDYKPDYLIRGYGEQAFRNLAELGFTAQDKIIQGEFLSLTEIPSPYLESDKPQLQGKMLYYEASRGCACKCVYCLSSREEKLDWLPVERVCSDIDKLLEFKPKVVKFVDRCFNLNKDWARAIWQYVISLNTNIPFHFEVHPDWLEKTDIELLSKVPKGRIQLEIGIQSIHPKTLSAIGRPSDWKLVKQNICLLREKSHIPLHVDLIAGLPGEDMSAVRQSVNEVLLTQPTELQLGFLKILQGTEMAKQALELDYKWTDTPPYQVLQTPSLSFSELNQLEKLSSIINQYWNKEDFQTIWQKSLLWREPFTCLEELLQLNLISDNQLHSIDRVKRYELMSAWIDQYWQDEQRVYLMDALRWDWCRKAGEAWFPPPMQAEHCLTFRKDNYVELYEWLKTEYWQHEDWNMKRFIAFSAISNDFAKDYLSGYTKALFVSQKANDNALVILTHFM